MNSNAAKSVQTEEFAPHQRDEAFLSGMFGHFHAPETVAANSEQASGIQKVLRLEAEIAAMPQVELETVHHFSPGLYARELRIPAGVVLTGKIHRTEHINVVSAGRMVVYSEDGGVREICAPFTFISKPGAKRVGIALEDTVWTCFHATSETDLDKLESDLVADSFEAYEAGLIGA